ncbi:MAG: hypothetical protein H6832_17005 [Planctomycetes bacterium]|nr:hypothetical protein [Planctomycetota bacterium]MCB9883072.1 hypothetical protein [Planctomycetota bacterium]MCB9890675.1 hypothetical protein [Planctomycetota bacterium]MCB9920102.1 hypothetical protein [Planctomycetota bacterium]
MLDGRTIITCAAAALFACSALPGQLQKGATPPPFEFKKVWNDGPASFDDLQGKLVIFDFAATW